MDSKEMFRKIIMQDHIQKIMNDGKETSENGEPQIIEMSRDDMLKSVFLGVQLCLNMMVYKGVCSHEEVMGMGLAIKEVIDEIFE